jgi:hypothetical protein
MLQFAGRFRHAALRLFDDRQRPFGVSPPPLEEPRARD